MPKDPIEFEIKVDTTKATKQIKKLGRALWWSRYQDHLWYILAGLSGALAALAGVWLGWVTA